MPVGDFLSQQDPTRPALAQDLLVPGAITIIAAPRGTGKSVTALALGIAFASGGVFRGERLPSTQVLLVDRDNPPVVVRKRLGWLGATAGGVIALFPTTWQGEKLLNRRQSGMLPSMSPLGFARGDLAWNGGSA